MPPPGSHHSTQKDVSLLKRVHTLIFKRWLISPHTLCKSASPHHPCLQWNTGYLAISDWLGFLRHRQWVIGGLWKGITLEPTRWHTHTCLCRIPLHFQALFSLESGGSKQVHSSPCPVWSHNTQPTEVCDPPSSAVRTYCYDWKNKKRLWLLYPNAKALSLFSFFSHVNQRSFISSAVKSKALSLRLGRLGSVDNPKSSYLAKIYYFCPKIRNEHKCCNMSINRRTFWGRGSTGRIWWTRRH